MEDIRCMDYDSMGDCGRFPNTFAILAIQLFVK